MSMASTISGACPTPRICIVTTGGTIAGEARSGLATDARYAAGLLSADALMASVPQITTLAQIRTEEIASIDSKDMGDALWLKLARRVNTLLNQEDVDGIVITHGTDTLEETALFLDLTLSSHKPVVLTAAMRPATALSADGPANLYQAVVTAVSVASCHRGVLVAINNQVLCARDIMKTHTTAVQAIGASEGGVLGEVYGDKVCYLRDHVLQCDAQPVFSIANLQALPKVGIVYGYAQASPLPITAFMAAQFDGIVCAGVGQGNLHKDWLEVLQQACSAGMLVVRASRVGAGTVHWGAADDAMVQLIASGRFNPQKSRVILMLALTQTYDQRVIQQYFHTL